jgi:hypothetical protein
MTPWERLARTLEGWTADGVAGDAQEAATTLRTLAAENDALRAEVAALRQAVERARGEEREACATIAEGRVYRERYRTWPWWINRDGSEGNRSTDSDIVQHADKIAAAIRARAGGAGDE